MQRFVWQDVVKSATTFVDSDWAGCKTTCRSTSGGVVTLGAHAIMSWSATQAVVALSSGEAELYALTKGAATTLGVMSLGEDFGMSFHAKVGSDASAAIGMVNRTGAGKLRHIRVQYLWIQDVVKSGQIGIEKVPGADNPADVFTKHVDVHTMRKHCWRLGYEALGTRASTAPTLNVLLGMLQSHFPEGDLEPEINEANNEKNEYETLYNRKTYEANGYKKLYEEDGKARRCRDRDEDSRRGPEQMDDWNRQGAYVVRAHERPRLELFTPLRVAGSPQAKSLTPTRITKGTYIDNGEKFRIIDTWTARNTAHRAMNRQWIGSTAFILKAAETQPYMQNNEPFEITQQNSA